MDTWAPEPAGLAQIVQTLRDSTNIHDKTIQREITVVRPTFGLCAWLGPLVLVVGRVLTGMADVELVVCSG
jgi:hypothetical protein